MWVAYISRDSAAWHVGRVGVNLGGVGPWVDPTSWRLPGCQRHCWAHGFSHLCGHWNHLAGGGVWKNWVPGSVSTWKVLSHVWLFATPWTIQSLEFSRPEYWSGECLHSQGDFPNPEIEPRSPALRADSLLAEPQGKPNNTGVGSLSLPQRIFLTQESNRGLPHCGQILYQLSHRGSLRILCA